jgi:hypothetical protein
MFGFNSVVDKRIILINFEGLAVYGMDNDRLMKLAVFADDDTGHRKFRDYVLDERMLQVTLMVDSPAEDFIIEKVPHVSAYERKPFLARKLDQHFRNVEYRSAKIVGRETAGRRDDRVLFSALTQTRNIDNWVRILLQEEVSIKSMTSPAFAICKVAKEFGLNTADSVLLINWQRNGIRQSLISNHKLMFSRLTPLPTDPEADLAKAILDASLQTKEYLERIDLLKPEQVPDLHVVSPKLEKDAFDDQPGKVDFAKVYHHNSIDLIPVNKYGGPQSEITAILLCLNWGIFSGEFGNVYASLATMRFKRLKQQRNLIAAACFGVLFLGAIIAAPVIMNTLHSQENYRAMTQDMLPIQEQYDALTAQFPETPIPSEAMALVVNNYNLINSQNYRPAEVLAKISQIVIQHPTISLSSFVWKLGVDEQYLEITDAVLANDTVVELDLYGEQTGTSSFQNSNLRLRAFIDSLNNLEGVSVIPISLPIESGPDAAVTTSVGDQVLDSEFSLNVRFES